MSTADLPQQRILEIDGLRAVAMTMVVAQHCGLLPFGWTGVWLFFVISGYVISRNFLLEQEAPGQPGARYAQFMVRRFFRIVPVYALYLLLATIAMLSSGNRGGLGDLPALATFTYNWQMIFGLWPIQDRFAPLGHLWTLSVEEQFYVFYPVLFLLLPRRRFIAAVCILIALGPVIRFMFSQLLASTGRPPLDVAFGVYAASFCHFDAFLIGALIAVAEPRLVSEHRWLPRIAFVAAVFAVMYTGLMIAVNYQLGARGIDLVRCIYSGIMAGQGREVLSYISIDLIAATLLTAAVTRHPAMRLLGTPVLVWVGRVSYGAYLYHALALWLLHRHVLQFSDGTLPLAHKLLMFAAGWTLTMLIASISFVWFEAPISAWAREHWRFRFAPGVSRQPSASVAPRVLPGPGWFALRPSQLSTDARPSENTMP